MDRRLLLPLRNNNPRKPIMDGVPPTDNPVSRRQFLRSAVGTTAALATSGLSAVLPESAILERRRRRRPPRPRPTPSPTPAAAPAAVIEEATIPQLQGFMASGAATSQSLVAHYQQRISSLNPTLHAVIEVNPNAISIAKQLDQERSQGQLRGPLHGIPILVKDVVATGDSMQTTAGSLALVGSTVPGDAVVVSRLRAAGAVILGKANLSEWSNFRGANPPSGWSARGGFTRNAYRLDWDVSGSSSGSAVAAAANLCAAAVGAETDGSILYPASTNLVVGIKPTVGLISQDGIIPVSRSQDTIGPMARTVTDAAILLGVLQSPFGPVLGHSVPSSYTGSLVRGALSGARIGVDRRYFSATYGAESDLAAMANTALAAMQHLGATLVDTNSGDPLDYADEERLVLLTEFKVAIAQYLSGLGNTSMRTLGDLIKFNTGHCSSEMRYFGQETFQQAQATSGNLSDSQYLAARSKCLQLARTQGIDAALHNSSLDAIVAPGYTLACRPAAVAGYPSVSIPLGLSSAGRPAALWMWSGFLQEAKLLGLAYDLEQQLQPRKNAPLMRGSLPPLPAAAGLC